MFTIIVNTVAGHGKALKAAARLEAALSQRGEAFSLVHTQYAGHATLLAKACAERGDDKVFCVGGDGTAFEVANGLLGSSTALGLIPGGTGNDFARGLGLPKDPVQAMEALLTATARPVDVGQVNDRAFLNVCGAGFDVEVVHAGERAKRFAKGMVPYLYGILHTLFTYKPRHFSIELDGEKQEGPLLLISVANGQYIGGGMHIAPMAKLDDGLLDVIMIQPVSRPRIAQLLPKFIDGSFIQRTDIVEHRRCRTIRIASPELRMQLDGELTTVEGALLRIADQKLQILMPQGR